MLYLPLVALLGYHWGIHHALASAILQLLCVSLFFLPTAIPRLQSATELVELAAVTGFVLLLTQLARYRHASAQRAVERLALLNQVGTALVSELEEERLLHLIAQTACTLTDAGFAAFTMRPTDELGHPTVPSEGHLFHLAAVVGVTEEQERLFRRMPLGGEGLLAPIFRHRTAATGRRAPSLCRERSASAGPERTARPIVSISFNGMMLVWCWPIR
jgi:signal transduction histidine kinase